MHCEHGRTVLANNKIKLIIILNLIKLLA